MAKITFLGAAGTVTGSKYLLEAEGTRILVDCGLFEGSQELRQRNWAPLPAGPGGIGAVVLTHAHIDHTGYLPRLERCGFRGKIYANPATRELCELLLPDSAHLQEEDALFASRKGYSRHQPPLPLYTLADAQAVLSRFADVPRDGAFAIGSQYSFRSHNAGHILGASWLELTITEAGKSLLVIFSGDVGRYSDAILKSPEAPQHADYLLCESTYGDREHPKDSVFDALAAIIKRVAARGGAIVIPAFAVARTQELLYILRQLEDAQRIPRLPVFIDSPMAISVTTLYMQHPEDHGPEFARQEQNGDPLSPHSLHMTRTVQASKQINSISGPCIIISASGMLTGGRILHHLSRRLADARNAVLIVGFQAEGTRGRALIEGAKTLRIFGQDVPVAAEIIELNQLSGHADRSELLRWLSGFAAAPKQTFIVHGEPQGSQGLRSAIEASLQWKNLTLPAYGQSFELGF